MTTTSLATDSAGAARSLDCLGRLGLAPDQVAAKVEEMRSAREAGDGAAMLATLDQARACWDVELLRTLHDGVAALAAMEAQRHG
jgi:hypothetical protein